MVEAIFMLLRQRIVQNTAIQVAGKIIGTGFSLVAAGLVFRLLHDDGYGRYTTVMAYLQIFGYLMDFGLYIVLIKKISVLKERSSRVIDTIFTMRVIAGVIFLGFAILIAMILSRVTTMYTPEVLRAIVVTTLFFFFISLNQLLSAFFQKALRTDWVALAELLGKITMLVATIIVVLLHGKLFSVMLTLVISAVINFGVNWFAVKKYFTIRLGWDWIVARQTIREAWPIALSILFTTIYFKSDSIILTFTQTANVVGWYGAPYKLLEVLITFPAMFAGLVMPLLTVAWQTRDHATFARRFQLSMDAMVLVTLPMIAGTFALAHPIMMFIAGANFVNSVPILQILIVAAAAIFFGTFLGYLVVALDHQRSMLMGYAVVAITALAGYLIVVKPYSIIGVALVTVYSEVTVAVWAFIIALRATHVHLTMQPWIRAFIAAAGMYGVIRILRPLVTSGMAHIAIIANLSTTWHACLVLIALVPIGMMWYVLLLFFLRAINTHDMRELFRFHQKSHHE